MVSLSLHSSTEKNKIFFGKFYAESSNTVINIQSIMNPMLWAYAEGLFFLFLLHLIFSTNVRQNTKLRVVKIFASAISFCFRRFIDNSLWNISWRDLLFSTHIWASSEIIFLCLFIAYGDNHVYQKRHPVFEYRCSYYLEIFNKVLPI